MEPPGTQRLEAFSDGVFAIAITLLVLTIQIPPYNPAHLGQLGKTLLQSWPSFAAYLISFAFILIMWVNHHNLFTLITRVSHTFLLLNGLLLMFVTLVPFPTGLLATYLRSPSVGDQRVAGLAFNGTYVLLALVFNRLWHYASKGSRLLARDVDLRLVDEVNRRYRFGPVVYLVCCALVFVNVYASIALNALLAIFFALPSNVNREVRHAVTAPHTPA